MEEWIGLLEELVKIPSETQNVPGVNRAQEFACAYLGERGLFTKLEEHGGRKVLFASTEEGRKPDILFVVHLDVVPAPKDMYLPRRDGDRLYGRGAQDCKGNAVAAIEALSRLKGRASAGALFSADEELGGKTTEMMAAMGYGARKAVIVLDATPYSIVTAEKGVVNLVLRARGTEAHSSMPWLGDNAIDKLVDGYLKLREAWPMAEAGAGRWTDTCSADLISGGSAVNKVPGEASLVLNIRFIEPGGEERIEKFVRETTGLEVERTAEGVSNPVYCDENDPVLLSLREEMQKVWPKKEIAFTKMTGATDARFFAQGSVPVAITGVEGFGCHTDEEGVVLSSIEKTVEAIVAFAVKESAK